MSRGISRERQVRKLLEDGGWWVTRAAGSKGDADLVALRAGLKPHLVEVKSSSGGPFEHFRPADRADLSAAAAQAGAEAWLCWWPPRKQPQWIAETDWPKARVSSEGIKRLEERGASDELLKAARRAM